VQIAADLRYLDPKHVAVAGTTCEGLKVRNAAGIIGKFQGFLVDPVAQRFRFVVFELLGRLRLLPVGEVRVDLDHGAIELLDDHDVRFSKPFRPEQFRTL
jgi:hypothetical protein